MAEQPARGMGRGLSAILPRSARDEQGLRDVAAGADRPQPAPAARPASTRTPSRALSESIRARGLLQPIVVRPIAGGTYELVAGERRLRAARMAELETVPALVRDTEDGERLELALAENMAREDLNPIEEARACATLVEDLGLTKEDVGRRVGRSRVAVSNLIRLLDLPDDVLELVESGGLSEGHGRALLTCRDHDARRRLAFAARDEGWSVRETERRAREAGGRAAPGARAGGAAPRPGRGAGCRRGRPDRGPGPRGEGKAARGTAAASSSTSTHPAEAVELAEKLLGAALIAPRRPWAILDSNQGPRPYQRRALTS